LLRFRVQQLQGHAEGLGGVYVDVRARIIVVAALVQHRHTGVAETLDSLIEVCHLESDVLDTLAVGVQVLLPTGIAAYGLDQFERHLTEFDKSQLRPTLGASAPEEHLHFIAGLGGAYLRWIDAEDSGPALTGDFDVAADNRHLGDYLHTGVAVGGTLGGGDGGEQGEKEC